MTYKFKEASNGNRKERKSLQNHSSFRFKREEDTRMERVSVHLQTENRSINHGYGLMTSQHENYYIIVEKGLSIYIT